MQGLRALCSAACRKQSGSRQTHDGTEQDSERCCQVHVMHPQLGRLAAGKAARQKVPWHSRGCDVFLVAGYQLGEGKCSAWRDLHTLGDTRLGSSQEPIIALGLGRKGTHPSAVLVLQHQCWVGMGCVPVCAACRERAQMAGT